MNLCGSLEVSKKDGSIMKKITRFGIGGPVGAGKTALIEVLIPRLVELGKFPLVITNDIVTTYDAEHVRANLVGVLDSNRIVGVETGTCPHTAVREDPTVNLLAMEELLIKFPDSDLVVLESGGDNLTLTFSSALVDKTIFVLDVAGGEKTPSKQGLGVIKADLLVINKIDLAPFVGADLNIMARDSEKVRDGRQVVFTNCHTGEGIDVVVDFICSNLIDGNEN